MKKIIILSFISITSFLHAFDYASDVEELITRQLETNLPARTSVEVVEMDNIHAHATQYFNSLVESHGKSFDSLPQSIQRQVTEKLTDINAGLNKKLVDIQAKQINKSNLENIINEALQHIIVHLAHYVENKTINKKVDAQIQDLFESYQLQESMIPEELKKEFEARRQVILNKLKQRMQNGKQDYVLAMDIKHQVHESLDKFMLRMQYILFGKWAQSYVVDIKRSIPTKTPCSSISTSDKTKRMHQSLRFLPSMHTRRI